MPDLFETTTIAGLTLRNRFVRSATWEGLAAETGGCTPQLNAMMADLAKGGVGLIISGHAYVSLEGQAGPRQLGVYSDDLLTGLRGMAEAVHQADGVIVLQLAHAGNQAATSLSGLPAAGPSPFALPKGEPCREMDAGDLAAVVDAFAKAANRAKQAGFDGVQIHAAHGYLLSQFLSPYFNQRTDLYGGTLENRSRLLFDVYRAIRDAVGIDFPVMVKLNSEDFLEPGLTQDDMLQVSAELETVGMDAVELSGGTGFSGKFHPIRKGRIEGPDGEGYYLQAARRFKARMKMPLMLVGGIRSYETAERIVKEGSADYISLCRPLIREPHLIKRWKEGDRRPSTCLSDNLCLKATRTGEGLHCVVEKSLQERED